MGETPWAGAFLHGRNPRWAGDLELQGSTEGRGGAQLSSIPLPAPPTLEAGLQCRCLQAWQVVGHRAQLDLALTSWHVLAVSLDDLPHIPRALQTITPNELGDWALAAKSVM